MADKYIHNSIKPSRRVQIVRTDDHGPHPYWKPGQFGYAVGYSTHPGMYTESGPSQPHALSYLVSKSKDGHTGASWFSAEALRFTGKEKLPGTRGHATKKTSRRSGVWPYNVSVGDEVYAVAGGRRHGPGIVEEIYDDGTMRVDFTRQFAGRLRLRPEDLIHVPGASHARKKKLTAHEAKRLLESEGIDFSKDYYASVSTSDSNRIAEVAKMAGYKKSKSAPGSTGRMYFQYLSRLK